MAEKKKRTNKTPEQLEAELKQQKQKEFIAEMEKVEDKFGLKIGVKLLYAEQGIVPRIILVEKTDNDSEQPEDGQD